MTHSSSYNSNNIIKRKPDSPMPEETEEENKYVMKLKQA